VSPRQYLADDLARLLDGEPAGLSCDVLAARLGRRRVDVLAVLQSDPRFTHRGRGRGSKWRTTAELPASASSDGLGRILLPWNDLDPSGVPAVRRTGKSA
jgi:hypothetical protein